MSTSSKILLLFAIAIAIGCGVVKSSTNDVDVRNIAPAPVGEPGDAQAKNTQTAVFAGGCFWGVDAVFKHVKGVVEVKSGYAGGERKTAEYERVSEGDTGHAESVKVAYDPTKVTYVQLLTVFFSVAHDPTELNRQGPDVGTQYRSAIFYANDEQKNSALAFIDNLNKSGVYSKPVVTQVAPLKDFFEAESYHQNYLANHPDEPYIVYNDLPKLAALKQKFPDLYSGK